MPAGHAIRFGDASFDIADTAIDAAPLGDDYFAVLRAFVRDTALTCSFHRERLERGGIVDGLVSSGHDFARIPFLAPGEVNAIPDAALMPDHYRTAGTSGLAGLPAPERIARKFLTTSSTGAPKGSYYTRDDWEAATEFGARLMGPVALARYCRLFNGFHSGHVAGKLMEDIFSKDGCIVENNHHTNLDTASIIHQLGSGLSALGGFNAMAVPPWRPAHLAGNKGATLHMLLDEDVDNIIGARIEVVIGGGAPFAPDARIKERTWEANELAGRPHTAFVHTYGAAEVGIVAADCAMDNGLHLLQGFVFTEVIDETTGEHVKNGETGLVVFTGLKHASRYLRYVVGDEAMYLDDPCACGRLSPRLQDIRRVMETERLNAGCAAGGY